MIGASKVTPIRPRDSSTARELIRAARRLSDAADNLTNAVEHFHEPANDTNQFQLRNDVCDLIRELRAGAFKQPDSLLLYWLATTLDEVCLFLTDLGEDCC